MAINWNELDSAIGIKDIIADEESGASTGDYAEVPLGNYDVSINKMEVRVSKSKNPMASIWFKVLAGEYKGSLIFMNQVLTQRFHFHKVNELLRELDSEIPDERIKILPLKDYNTLLMDIFEAVSGKLEYGLKYGEDNKGYKTFEITDVYDAPEA